MVRLDFVDAVGQPAPMVFDQPDRMIEAWRVDQVRSAMAEAEAACAAGYFVAGFVAYEAAGAFDDALTTRAAGDMPLVWFGVFAAPTREEPTGPPASAAAADHAADADPAWSTGISPAQYRDAIARVRRAIEDGDSYQANYTFALRSRLDASTLHARHRRLVAEQRPPYAAWLDIGRWRILSLSPELFFRLESGRITTRPMKGTAPRGLCAEDDERQREALRHSAKNHAENVMIVDLARNDIGRIAEVGSVAVPSLFDIERYRSVFQMTSTVTGHVRAGTSMTDVFDALFPAGSITGAPKASSMRLIAEIEQAPRGVYCGAIGFMAPGGDAVFNVAIRTAVVEVSTGTCEYGVGGGITWDSVAADEYAEAVSKASFLRPLPPFDLIETMRLEGGVVVRGDRHLRRLASSAAYFDIPLDEALVAHALDGQAHLHPTGCRRVRLLLGQNGDVRVESVPLAEAILGRRAVALADSPVSSDDRFLYHKTTRRGAFDRRRACHPGAFDILLANERGELTEFTIGNVVIEIDGRRLTPPRHCGLLAGVFREELLEHGAIVEHVLTIDDLARATGIWLINSVREWVEVEIASQLPAKSMVQ